MEIAPQDTMATGECYEPGCPVRFYEEAHREAGHNSVTAFSWYEPRRSYVGHAWASTCDEHLAAAEAALARSHGAQRQSLVRLDVPLPLGRAWSESPQVGRGHRHSGRRAV